MQTMEYRHLTRLQKRELERPGQRKFNRQSLAHVKAALAEVRARPQDYGDATEGNLLGKHAQLCWALSRRRVS